MVRLRVRYTGTVQGVGFRATAAHLARSIGVGGFVRNEPDGSVLLEAQGPRERVDRLLEAIRQRMGRLIRAEAVDEIPVQEGEAGFEIRI